MVKYERLKGGFGNAIFLHLSYVDIRITCHWLPKSSHLGSRTHLSVSIKRCRRRWSNVLQQALPLPLLGSSRRLEGYSRASMPRFALPPLQPYYTGGVQGNSRTLFMLLRPTQETNIGPFFIGPFQPVLPWGESAWKSFSPGARFCPSTVPSSLPPSPPCGIFIKSRAKNKALLLSWLLDKSIQPVLDAEDFKV